MSELLADFYAPLHKTLTEQGYTPERAWEIIKTMFGDTSETN
jgi:hypothetical protein